jgi:hypothetical protein
MARARQTTPAGHGEVLTSPDYAEWARAAAVASAAANGWTFELAGVPVGKLRALARREAIERARDFSARIGVAIGEVSDEPALLAVTGHQPEFYHPGVWIKDFLLQRFADETGAAALDLVVDSDGFDALEIHAPCLKPEVRVCRAYLAVGTTDGCYGCTPVPSAEDIETFCEAGSEHLATLTAPAIGHHFARFCRCLRDAVPTAANVAELVTFARRRYEAAAGTDYLEVPVSSMSRSRAFATFVAHIALDATAFADAYNAALGAYRERTATRNAAQPFPDLELSGELVELPFWHLAGGRRTLWARTGERPALLVGGEVACDLSRDPAEAVELLLSSGVALAPKALALTLYTRALVADLFIHGVGGGRYDQVTDDVFRRYLGVEPPPFVVASMTMYLPLGAHEVKDEEIEALSMALNRLRHNPDQMLDEVEFEAGEERAHAAALAREKGELVVAIAAPGADKKVIGGRIREVNAELAELLAPIERDMRDELDQLLQLQGASGILTDRTYPFCFWDPSEVADKAR